MSQYIDPHIHMISRTTDDYSADGLRPVRRRQRAGVLGRVRPRQRRRRSTTTSASSPSSSRSGPRSSASSTTPGCASTPRKPRTSSLSREVIALIPEFLKKPNVLGIGEIGLNKNTANEATVFQEHLDLAVEDRRADPDPHAAPGGQVQGHADDRGHAQGRPADQAAPRVHRSRRGAHRQPRARQRLLVRDDALPDDEVHAGAGVPTSSRWSAPTGSWRTRPATGASRTRWRCRN